MSWFALLVGLGLLGRATIISGSYLGLAWPASGAVVLWWHATPRSKRGRTAILITLATLAFNLATGGSWDAGLVFAAANLALASTAVVVLRGARKALSMNGRGWRLRSTADLWTLAVAAAAGSLVGTIVGSVGMVLVRGVWSWADTAAWWISNTTGVVAVAAVGQLLADRVPFSGPVSRWGRRWMVLTFDLFRQRFLELFLLAAVTVALYMVVFVWFGQLPVAFALLIPTVWAGMRFDPFVVHLHSLAVAASTVVLTLRGLGPYAEIASPHHQVLVTQTFCLLTTLIGLFLALGRQERRVLLTELALAQRHAHERALLMTTVVDSIQDGVSLIDEEGRVLIGNPAGSRLLGVTDHHRGRIHVRSIGVRGPGGEPIEEKDLPFGRAFASQETVVQDLLLSPIDGSSERLMQVSVTPVRDQDPSMPRRAVSIFRDVTDERAQQEALQSFAGIAAHDLSNPLALITGWAELAEDELDRRPVDLALVKSLMGQIQRAGGSMHELIRDLLALSTTSEVAVDLEEVDLESIARDVALLRTEGADPEPRIVVGPIPAVLGERALLRQLLDNLVGNAVKYVRPGEQAQVRISGRTRSDGWVEVSVSDKGIGIPEEQRDRVFLAFRRAHAADYPGHGLGLSICRGIVERHGGLIRASANPDRVGTRIVIRLRSPEVADAPPAVEDAAEMPVMVQEPLAEEPLPEPVLGQTVVVQAPAEETVVEEAVVEVEESVAGEEVTESR